MCTRYFCSICLLPGSCCLFEGGSDSACYCGFLFIRACGGLLLLIIIE